jgi:hypothetical protein
MVTLFCFRRDSGFLFTFSQPHSSPSGPAGRQHPDGPDF